MIGGKLLSASAAVQPTYIEDVFSTYLYTGNSSTQTITNGIDLAGEGGMVWLKARSAANSHAIYDTLRGNTLRLNTNTTGAAQDTTTSLSSFNSNGFSLSGSNNQSNESPTTYASWTFRKAPRFFDVVTYTGNGATGRQIAHDLGHEVGTLIIKRTDSTGSWIVYHRSIGTSKYLALESTSAAPNFSAINTVTSTYFVSDNQNTNGATYVAYLFAHDPLGPSGDGSDGLIACGSFTATGAEQEIDVGFEPQFVIRKVTNAAANWAMFDNMRGFSQTNTAYLNPNLSNAESNYTGADNDKPTSRGFKFTGVNGQTHIYIAIRRGPMREPTVGTEVFDAYFNSSSVTLGQSTGVTIVPDFVIARDITAATRDFNVADRLRGAGGINPDASFSKAALYTNTTGAEVSDKPFFDIINRHGNVTVGGEGAGVAGLWGLFLKRAPGFFDVVAYRGTGSTGTKNHNLGVVPEMMIFKNRNDTDPWIVYHQATGNTGYTPLNMTSGFLPASLAFNNTSPTASVFTVGSTLNFSSSFNYIAYLFASLPGVSKVGSYTGNGSSQTINCGFTTGARFILIKRTDSTGDWYVWDTKQGIVSGNDPRLKLNDPGSQVTTDDSVDPANSGFIVNQDAATNVNVNAATYIYLAIA